MKYVRWHLPTGESGAAERLMEDGYPYLLSLVLGARGVASAEEASNFLSRDEELTHSPFLMRDMDKAVARISLALKNHEKIAVYGDYDVDGITSTCLLTDYLRSAGGDCIRYIPRRVEDGYGLGEAALLSLREQGATLLITVDCGITGVDEIAYAASLGMDAVVTDHHECKEILPDACAVVDPHRPDCPYPFKQLAGVGVTLKLVLALGGEGREGALFARYSALAAIGTIADVMRMEGENRAIVQRGLEALPSTDFVGIHALLQEAGLAGKEITSTQIGFVLAPRINAAGRMGAADKAADLLDARDSARAEELARELCALNRERQSVEGAICEEAIAQIDTLPASERSALVLASEGWHQGVVGIVASRLAEKYSCPSFMIHLADGLGKGSCRSYGGFNLFAALEHCQDLLEGFGGHELAAGFTIREEQLKPFRTRMNRYVREACGGVLPVSSLEVDAVIAKPSLLSREEVGRLSELEPFGAGNARPVFCLLGATVDSLQNIGQGKHLKLRLSRSNQKLDAIFFGTTAELCGVHVGQRVDAAFYLQLNEFRGNTTVQLQMIDLRPSLSRSKNEAEALGLLERLFSEAPLTAQEATRLLPSREQFVRLWQELRRRISGATTTATLPLLRELAGAMGGSESFLRAALGLRVFAERGLVSLERGGDALSLALTADGMKVDLLECPYLVRLRRILM